MTGGRARWPPSSILSATARPSASRRDVDRLGAVLGDAARGRRHQRGDVAAGAADATRGGRASRRATSPAASSRPATTSERTARASPVSVSPKSGRAAAVDAGRRRPARRRRPSTVARERLLERVLGVEVGRVGPSRCTTQVASIAACLPEQFIASRSGSRPARSHSVRAACGRTGTSGGFCRPSRPSPAPARMRADALEVERSSPECEAADEREQLAVEVEPAAEHADGLQRLVGRAREDRLVRVRRAENATEPSASRTTTRPAVHALDEAGPDDLGDDRQAHASGLRRRLSSADDVGLAVAVAPGDLGGAACP